MTNAEKRHVLEENGYVIKRNMIVAPDGRVYRKGSLMKLIEVAYDAFVRES